MRRRTLLVVLIFLNATTPALAGICSLECAFAQAGAVDSSLDCHERGGASDGRASDGAASGDDDPDSRSDALMQAACAFAATASIVPSVTELPGALASAPADAALISLASRTTPPPQQPPRL